MASVALIFAVICGSGLGFSDMHSDVLSLASGKTVFAKRGGGLLRMPMDQVEENKTAASRQEKHHHSGVIFLRTQIAAWSRKEKHLKENLAEMKESLKQAKGIVKAATVRRTGLQSATSQGGSKIRQANILATAALDSIKRTHTKAVLALSSAAAVGVESTRGQRISQRIGLLTGAFAPLKDVVPKTTERLKRVMHHVERASMLLQKLKRFVKLVSRQYANARRRVAHMKLMLKRAERRVTKPDAVHMIHIASVVEAKAQQMLKVAKQQARRASCRINASSNATVGCRAMKELTRAKHLAETGRALRSAALGLRHRLKKSFSTPSTKRNPLLFGSNISQLANHASTLALQAVSRARSVVRGSSQLKRMAALLNGTERQPVTLESTSKQILVGKKAKLKARSALDRLRSAFRKAHKLERVAKKLRRNATVIRNGEESDVKASNTSASIHIASLNERSQIHLEDIDHDVAATANIAKVASTSTAAQAVATTEEGSNLVPDMTALIDRFHHTLRELENEASHSGGSAKRLRRRFKVLSKTLKRTARQSNRAAFRKLRQMRRVLTRAFAVAAARRLSVEILDREKQEWQLVRETSTDLRSAADEMYTATLETSKHVRALLKSRAQRAASAALPLSRDAKVWKRLAGKLIAKANTMKAPKRARARARRVVRLARREFKLSALCKRLVAKYHKHELVIKKTSGRTTKAKQEAKKALAAVASAASKSRSMRRNAARAERGPPRGAKYLALARKTAQNARKQRTVATAALKALKRRVKAATSGGAKDMLRNKIKDARVKVKKAKSDSKKAAALEAKAQRLAQEEKQDKLARVAKEKSEKASRTLSGSVNSGTKISGDVKTQAKMEKVAVKKKILAKAGSIAIKMKTDLRFLLYTARIARGNAALALSKLTSIGKRSDRIARRTSRKATRTALRGKRRLKAAAKRKRLARTKSQKARAELRWHTALRTRKQAHDLRVQAGVEAKAAKRKKKIASTITSAVGKIRKLAKEARSLRTDGKISMKRWTKRLKKSPASSIDKPFGQLKKQVAALSKRARVVSANLKTLGKKVRIGLVEAKQ